MRGRVKQNVVIEYCQMREIIKQNVVIEHQHLHCILSLIFSDQVSNPPMTLGCPCFHQQADNCWPHQLSTSKLFDVLFVTCLTCAMKRDPRSQSPNSPSSALLAASTPPKGQSQKLATSYSYPILLQNTQTKSCTAVMLCRDRSCVTAHLLPNSSRRHTISDIQ